MTQVASSNILPRISHETFPFFYQTQSQWDQLADKLKDPWFQTLHERNMKALAAFEAETNDNLFEVPYLLDTPEDERVCRIEGRILKNRIERLVAAYYITQDEQYIDKSVSALDAGCESDKWHVKGNNIGLHGADLHTGDLMFAVAFGVDALYHKLPVEKRAHYQDTLINIGLGAYWDGIEANDWWVVTPFNWGPSLHCNACLAALAIAPVDPGLAERTFIEAFKHIPTCMDTFQVEGGFSEGPMYQTTAFGHLTDFLIAYYNLTGEDLGILSHQGIHDALDFLTYLVGGDQRPYNISNCNEFSDEFSSGHAFWWAKQKNQPQWAAYSEQFLRPWQNTHQLFYDIDAFWLREPFQEATPLDTSGLKHASNIDWLTWKGDKLWMAFKSGWNSGGHHNMDAGHLILGYGKERYLIDPGYGAGATYMHNAFTLGGKGSQPGQSHGKITDAKANDKKCFIACDLHGAWPLSTLHAYRYVWVLDDCHVVIVDDILATERMLFTNANWHWQTRHPVDITDQTATVKGDKGNLRIQALGKTDGLGVDPWEHQNMPINRLHWRDFANERHSFFPTVLSFENPDTHWELKGDSATLKVNAHELTFKKQGQRWIPNS